MPRHPILALLLACLAAPAAAGGVVQTQAVQTPQLAPGFSLRAGGAQPGTGMGPSPAGANVSLGSALPSLRGPSVTVQPAAESLSARPQAELRAPQAQSPSRTQTTLSAPAARPPARAGLSRPEAAVRLRQAAPSALERSSLGPASRAPVSARDERGARPEGPTHASLGRLGLRLGLPSDSKALSDESVASAAASAWDGASISQARGRSMPAAGSLGMQTASGLRRETQAPAEAKAPMPAPRPAPDVPNARPWIKGALWTAGILAAVVALFAGAQTIIASMGAAGISGLSAGNIGLAVLAGILSFLSPCTLPLIPGYISMISGSTLGAGAKGGKVQRSSLRTGLASIAFVAGFTVIFTALGASATSLGGLLLDYMPLITKIAGGVVAVFGAHLLLSSFGKTIPFLSDLLYREKRFHVDKAKAGLLGAFLMGMAFAFGWTPCIGPILGGILGMAAMEETVAAGIVLLAAYSLGLGIPFILTGFAVEKFNAFFQRYKRFIGWGERASGLILFLLGLLIATNSLAKVMGLLGL